MTNPWTQPSAPVPDDLPELHFSRREMLWDDLRRLLPDRYEQVGDQLDVLSALMALKIGLYVRRWAIPLACSRLCIKLCRDALEVDRRLHKAMRDARGR